MKKLIFFFMLFTGVALVSCQKNAVKPAAVSSTSSMVSSATGASKYIVGGGTYDTHPGSPFNGDIHGNWKIVSDSAWNGGGLGNGDTVFVIKSYTGAVADRYNFTSSGMLYVNQNGSADTAAYTQNKNVLQLAYTFLNNQSLGNIPYNNSFGVDQLNANSIAIYRSLAAPGGFYDEKIILTKE
jgi:hypothetical protein